MSKIVKILKVEDTRKYQEEPDGRFYSIPGSGSEHECDRCGRIHEVHATVQTDDGQTLTVGTGCMLAESTEISRALLRLDHVAKRLAEYRAIVASMQAALAAYDKAYQEVERLPVPSITKRRPVPEDNFIGHIHPDRDWVYCCSDAIYLTSGDYEMTNREQVTWQWHHKRMTERGYRYGRGVLECKNGHGLRYYQKQIERLEKTLQEVTP